MIQCIQRVLLSFWFIILCLHFTDCLQLCFVCVSFHRLCHRLCFYINNIIIICDKNVQVVSFTELLSLKLSHIGKKKCFWSVTFVSILGSKHCHRESLCCVFVSCHSLYTAAHCQTTRVTADEVVRVASTGRALKGSASSDITGRELLHQLHLSPRRFSLFTIQRCCLIVRLRGFLRAPFVKLNRSQFRCLKSIRELVPVMQFVGNTVYRAWRYY